MKLHKRVIGHPVVKSIIGRVAAAYIRLVFLTGRWSVESNAEVERLWDQDTPFILCFWHGRLMMMPKIWRPDRVIHMLMSDSRDGQLITETVTHFGIRAATGSSSRTSGATSSLRRMLRALRGGESIGITPDGSRGPRMRVGGGCVEIARMSKAALVPATYSCARGKVLGSWDRFLVPLPFTRGIFVWGAPIHVDAGADQAAIETVRGQLEAALNAITEEADRRMGRTPVRPAAVESYDLPADART